MPRSVFRRHQHVAVLNGAWKSTTGVQIRNSCCTPAKNSTGAFNTDANTMQICVLILTLIPSRRAQIQKLTRGSIPKQKHKGPKANNI